MSTAQEKAAERKAARVVFHSDPTPEAVAKRDRLESNMGDWMRYYLPEAFPAPWCGDHLRVIAKLEAAIHHGGLFAQAMPRGHGKSTICQAAMLYAVLTGRRQYVVAVFATKELALSAIDFTKLHLCENDLLAEHYPHACHYFAASEGKPQRLRSQIRKDHEPVGALMKVGHIVLPRAMSDKGDESYPCDGAIIQADGMTGAIRGKKADKRGGKVFRPDFAILDDPQTRESAESPTQCDKRERTIMGDVLGLAGPLRKIAAVMPCTIIYPNDLAARFLSHKAHPEWQGETARLVYDWPTAQDTLWREYAELYRSEAAKGHGAARAKEFYLANREAMDAGARVSWEHRIRDGEVSAIQTAENLLIESGDQFHAEYQNAPKVRLASPWTLEPEDVMRNLSRIRRGLVPDSCHALTVAGDVNLYGISWVAVGWTSEGAGYLVDWGKYPPGEDAVLWKVGSKETEEQAVFRGVSRWVEDVFSRPYRRETSEPVSISGLACDCSYKRDPVFQALAQARRSRSGTEFAPIRGLASMHYRPRNETSRGDQWHVGAWGRGKVLFHNSDYWRERAQKSWYMPVGGPGGSMAVFGDDPNAHRILANQITAEFVVDVGVSERHGQFTKWDVKPGERNDLGDAVVYAFVLASKLNVRFGAMHTTGALRNAATRAIKPDDKSGEKESAPPRATRPIVRRGRGGFVGSY